MPRRTQIAHGYKELSFQQLRSFVETARLGTLSGAADFLGLTHPTVWMQVHALERRLGAKLVEAAGRGVRLTDAGRALAALATPLVREAGTLQNRFDDVVSAHRPAVVITTTPRVLNDDLLPCVRTFAREHPQVDLTLVELSHEEAVARLEQGQADLAVLAVHPVRQATGLDYQLVYELNYLLITPPKHPLARARVVRPEDLVGHPLVNGPEAFSDLSIRARLDELGLFDTRPCRVAAQFTATSRHYVREGFGIAIVSKHPSLPADPTLHERDMSRYFGRVPVQLIRRKGEQPRPAVQAFETVVRDVLGTGRRGRG
jgi:DNA-binding transcriptional LysR family regulator